MLFDALMGVENVIGVDRSAPRKLVRKVGHQVSLRANPGGLERVVERGQIAFRMRTEGKTVRAIAEELGVSEQTISTDIKAVREALRRDAVELAEEERDIMAGQCRQIIAKFAPVVLDGEVAIMLDRDGRPLLNADRIEAISKAAAVILKAQERLAKLFGLDAPERVVADVTGRVVQDEELAARIAEQSPLVAAMSGAVDRFRSRRAALPAVQDAEVTEVPATEISPPEAA